MEEGENQRWEDVRFPSYKVVSVDLREGKSEWKLKWRTVLQKTASYERFLNEEKVICRAKECMWYI